MDRRCFAIMCHLLRTIAGLISTEAVDVEEMVAMFFHILAHDVKNCVIQREFMRSNETIFHHFNMVLLVAIRLHDELLKKPQLVPNDCTDKKWRCIRWNVHKSQLQQVTRLGYYYLVDVGYPNAEDFLAPYRGQGYHLQEWCDVENASSMSKEFFNMKHSSARNVIGRAFNVLKNDIDEVDSTHASTTSDDIHYIDTFNEWSQWSDEFAEEMFSDWELHNHMTSTLRLPKHSWTKEEEADLVKCLVELVNVVGWRFDNWTFRPKYLYQLMRMMAFKIPGCNVHASTIDSRIKLLKRMFHALAKMHGPTCSSPCRDFCGRWSNDPTGYEAFAADDVLDMDFQPMYVLNGSKQKRGGQATNSGEVIHTAIEYGNEQLNRIVEWLVLRRQDASQTRQKVVQQLEAIPELTLMDRCQLMYILMRNVDDMKAFLDIPDNMKYSY
ncbi:retrotransposon protein [Cucumis melo var. makuwa]|uniref:Retrotransposon protein n=1 Tax=Cucumis melo var. makuwa TaxID=1194695 RepID=A0A5A7SXP3_CUCMM|nr:retrotransposon protein [Cucumis melo var. makuwa]TYK30431.1 retrotransposon protein [Cucumis melo var. makuwa]